MGKSKKLLVIEIDDESSVPRVFYKGVEKKQKTEVSLNRTTQTDILKGELTYKIDHYDDYFGLSTIEY